MNDDVILTPVRDIHRFDESTLSHYLTDHTELGRIESVEQFDGGQSNPTYLLHCEHRDAVLRKQPPGVLLPSAHQVDREYRVQAALANTDVPVPEMYALCEDPSVLGGKFYVMEKVESRLFLDSKLPGLPKAERTPAWQDIIGVLATLHQVDHQAVGLGDFGRPGNYYARQIGRWSKQYVASRTEDIDAMDKLMAWLPDNIPDGDETCIAHGDFRVGNLLLHPTEPRVAAVLDWELCTLGHPLADLGYLAQVYYADSERQPGLFGYDLEEWGLPDEETVLAAYCAATGRREIENWRFYLIYNLFRTGAIVEGVYRRGLDGNASSASALEYKGICRQRAELAWDLVQRGSR